MRRTNPELNISSEQVNDFLVKLREYFLSSSKAWDACRNEIFRLMELQATLRELSYWDLTGRARVATALARIVVQIPLKMRDAWEAESKNNVNMDGTEPFGDENVEGANNANNTNNTSRASYLGGAFGNAFWVILGLVDRSCENVDWVLSTNPWSSLRGLTFTSVYETGRSFFYGKGLTAT